MKLDSRQIATILHALRVQQLGCSPNECEHFDEVTTQLDSDEMDELCEQLNTTGTRSPHDERTADECTAGIHVRRHHSNSRSA